MKDDLFCSNTLIISMFTVWATTILLILYYYFSIFIPMYYSSGIKYLEGMYLIQDDERVQASAYQKKLNIPQ